jgi:hypothetical protein
MALNKLENEIKSQLNSREIKPSAQAWDRLDAMLTVAEKPKKKFPWFLVAASFIGFVFIGTFFFKLNVVTPKTPVESIVVHNTDTIITNSSNKPIVLKDISNSKSDSLIENKINLVSNQNQVAEQTINSKKINKNKEGVSIVNNNRNQVLVNIYKKTEDINVELPSNDNKKQELVSNKNQVASSEELNFNPEIVLSEPKKIKINATSLLSQVDDEIRKEEQQNIFQKIGKNLQTVKVAFVERNIKK